VSNMDVAPEPPMDGFMGVSRASLTTQAPHARMVESYWTGAALLIGTWMCQHERQRVQERSRVTPLRSDMQVGPGWPILLIY